MCFYVLGIAAIVVVFKCIETTFKSVKQKVNALTQAVPEQETKTASTRLEQILRVINKNLVKKCLDVI